MSILHLFTLFHGLLFFFYFFFQSEQYDLQKSTEIKIDEFKKKTIESEEKESQARVDLESAIKQRDLSDRHAGMFLNLFIFVSTKSNIYIHLTLTYMNCFIGSSFFFQMQKHATHRASLQKRTINVSFFSMQKIQNVSS